MSISVEFAPEVETMLNREAVRHGSSPDAYIREIIEKTLMTSSAEPATPGILHEAQAQSNASTIALLEKWRIECEAAWAEMTPEERNREEADWADLRNALNENRRFSGE